MIKFRLTKAFVTKVNPVSSLQNSRRTLLSQHNTYEQKVNSRIGILGADYNKYNFSYALIKKKLDSYWRLCRGHQPIGALLLYWPTAWGVCIGSPGLANMYYLLLFLMGSWTARSAGCIVNDYFDRQFDKQVERTKSRPLASGQVSLKQAKTLLFLNLCGGLYVLLNLPTPALFVTAGFVGMAAAYPLAKRYTDYPQLVLGMCFNSGIIIGALAANPSVFVPAMIPIYISGIAWTMIYDTVYAYQDLKDDLKIGVKSTAVAWHKKNPKLIMQKFAYLIVLCHLSLTLFDPNYVYAVPIMLLADYFLIQQLKNIRLDNRADCAVFFGRNNMYGAVIFISLLLVSIVREWRLQCNKKVEKAD